MTETVHIEKKTKAKIEKELSLFGLEIVKNNESGVVFTISEYERLMIERNEKNLDKIEAITFTNSIVSLVVGIADDVFKTWADQKIISHLSVVCVKSVIKITVLYEN